MFNSRNNNPLIKFTLPFFGNAKLGKKKICN